MTVERKIIVNAAEPEETRIAVVEEGKLCEFFIERIWDRHMAGDIYKARVDTVLPGMHAAFVNLGEGRNAFLYLADAKGHKVEPNAAILVQVMRVARKGKGARVTAHISLPGRYVVLVPGGREIGVSRRIESPEERRRLRTLARQLLWFESAHCCCGGGRGSIDPGFDRAYGSLAEHRTQCRISRASLLDI